MLLSLVLAVLCGQKWGPYRLIGWLCASSCHFNSSPPTDTSHQFKEGKGSTKKVRRQWSRDVASGADRHLDITFGLQLVESSSLVSVLFREAFNHPYISFFHLLVNGFSVIRECSSTLYVGLACTVLPTNTNFRLTFLLTGLQEAVYEDFSV